MIERKSVLDRVEIERDGTVGVRILLLLVEGGEELSQKYHRTSIPVEVDPTVQMGYVNDHLRQMGEEELDVDSLADIASLHAVAVVRAQRLAVQPPDEVKE